MTVADSDRVKQVDFSDFYKKFGGLEDEEEIEEAEQEQEEETEAKQ